MSVLQFTPACFIGEFIIGVLFAQHDGLHHLLSTFEEGKLVEIQLFYQPQFFIGFHFQPVIQPEGIDGTADIPVAISETVDPPLHGIAPDPAGNFLEIRNG